MHLKTLQFNDFRNYKNISLEFPQEGALLEGLNGSGKTNLLEGIYLLCTGRSQRGANRSSMINHMAQFSFLEGIFINSSKKNSNASIGFGKDKKVVMKIDDVPVNSFTEWFGHRAAVSFGADDLKLVYGAPEDRRRFLDILGSQIDREYLESLLQYRQFLLKRNLLLTERHDSMQIEIYEEKMAASGAKIIKKRSTIISLLSEYVESFYRTISDNRERVTIAYLPSISYDTSSENGCKDVFYKVLNERREKDIAMGCSSVGPHRDEIKFLLDNKPAKTFGSQGQCRSIALSLKLSSVQVIEKFRNEKMIFLIDDAVSELDQNRTSRVYPLIEGKGQIFIATPSLNVPLKSSVLRCRVHDGMVEALC